MNNIKTIWILSLATIFVMTLCWSIATLTIKSEKLIDSVIIVVETGGSIYKQAGNWVTALLPPELCEDIGKYTKDYYQQYGKDDLRYLFDSIKGEAAKRKMVASSIHQ